jgi:hypothetical protein
VRVGGNHPQQPGAGVTHRQMQPVAAQLQPQLASVDVPLGPLVQQMRSNSALRTRTSHHAPALLAWCNGLLCKGSA